MAANAGWQLLRIAGAVEPRGDLPAEVLEHGAHAGHAQPFGGFGIALGIVGEDGDLLLDGGLDQVEDRADLRDRKSTRLNSSHLVISYAVFCLKKKKNKHT